MALLFRMVLGAVLPCVFMSSVAIADISRFSWQGVLRYAPDKVVLLHGGTLGDLMNSLGADASANQLPISGTFSYDELTRAGTANQVAAGYPQSVLSATIRIGDQEVSADLGMIRTNAESSRVGMLADPGGGFCGDADHCEPYGVRPPGWGNQIAILNDTPHVLIDESGGTPETGDAIGFMLGRTAAAGEFSPALRTSDGRTISVDGLSVLMFSRSGAQMLNSLAVPAIEDVAFADTVGRTEIWLFLEGPDLFQTIRIEGTLTSVSASVSASVSDAPAVAEAWNFGYGQGTAVARVAANESSIAVHCPEGAIGDTSPSIWFTPGGGPRSGQGLVAYAVDGIPHAFNGIWNAGGAIEVKVGSGTSRAQFDDLIAALASGNSVEAMAGDTRRSYSLAGSAKALTYVMSFCP